MNIPEKWRIRLKIAGWILTGLFIAGCLLTAWAFYVVWQCGEQVYTELDAVPAREYALLPGTSKMVGKYENLYFRHRITAAVELYHAGKVKRIIVSGDNRHEDYNEPRDMYQALIEAGIPAQAIELDYAGFRTLDSVLRCRNVFGVSSFLIVSQHFHCRRAIYLAKAHGLDAVGYAAEDTSQKNRYRRYLRETAACLAAWLDVNLLRTKPHFEY